jgi:hypothetical protein
MRLISASALGVLLASAAAGQSQSPRPATSNPVTHVQTAADLAAVCNPSWSGVPRLEAIAYCQGFITSDDQHHALLHPPGGRARPLYCLPSPAPTVAQGGIAFAAWLAANPTYRAEPAVDALLRWKQAAFPCPPTTAPARASRSTR